MSSNIKSNRASIDDVKINSFFVKLTESLQDIEPENIVNYDETNFTDDPGSQKVIGARNVKRIERVMDTSKQSTSVMFAANGTGTLLPPYIVHTSTHLYDIWSERGPEVLHITGKNQSGSTRRHLSIGLRRLLYHSSVVKRARSV